MRVRLINSPIRLNAPPNCIPYGLAAIAAVLRDANHHVEILDLNALRPDEAETERLVREGRWDLIGLSGLITTYAFQKKIAPVIREAHPNAFLVTGGGLATSVPELVMEKIPVDAAVIGEGEVTARELADALADGRDLAQVDGLVLRDGAKRVGPALLQSCHGEAAEDMKTTNEGDVVNQDDEQQGVAQGLVASALHGAAEAAFVLAEGAFGLPSLPVDCVGEV